MGGDVVADGKEATCSECVDDGVVSIRSLNSGFNENADVGAGKVQLGGSVVDPFFDVVNLTRHLDGDNAKDVMSDIVCLVAYTPAAESADMFHEAFLVQFTRET